MSVIPTTPPQPLATWQPAGPPRELTAEQLHFHPALTLDFRTTAELEPLRDFTGQERARAALELGLGVASSGFNIFVSGLTGVERTEEVRAWVAQRAAALPTPGDWVYVHNFTRPDTPTAIALAAGQGRTFKRFMNELIKTLRDQLPKAFRQEAFDKEKAHLRDKYTAKAHALAEEYSKRAREKGFLIQAGPGGHFLLIPLVDGKPLEPEAFAKLSEERGESGKATRNTDTTSH